MNRRLAKLSFKGIKILLVLFCLCWGGLSVYFIVHAVFSPKSHSIQIEPVNIPRHLIYKENETENKVGRDVYEEIQDYKKYMDSIHQPIRQGMLDSMNMLEQIYLSQQKTKVYEK